MEGPYWDAVRHGKAEYWYRSSGAYLTVFWHLDALYRSDCRRRTSERRLRSQGWMSAAEFLESERARQP
jgi:hypothetical protein